MGLLVAKDVERSFGDRHVLRGCDLTISVGDRVGLVGPNGCGKSTFLSILGGHLEPDHGRVRCEGRLASLEQDPVLVGEVVGDVVDGALAWHRRLLAEWNQAVSSGELERAAALQDRLDTEGWEIDHKADALLSRLRAPDRTASIATLSGGERRRVALAIALLHAPDVLLLDEPSNHLDADTVEWLQAWLTGFRGALVLVTHDRYLLEAVANRIVEVEQGCCVTYDDASYTDYLIARAERRATLQRAEDGRLALLAREAEWAARSPSARSTKQKARLQRLEELRSRSSIVREDSFDLDLRSGKRLGSTILELHGISKRFGERRIVEDLSLSLRPGDRLGLVGPNGAGKTTLLRLIQGELTLDGGEILRGRRVQIGVLDQHRTGLNESDTVFETVGGGNDQVKVGDHWVHVATFLRRFLFSREVFDQQVSKLSGGERARLLLARLLLRGANLLLLDEPTNDLDLMTLRVLEDALLAYDGCAVVVTHDRAFLDRVCNGVLAFEGEGRAVRYADRLQYLAAAEQRRRAEEVVARPPGPVSVKKPRGGERRGLSYRERGELEELPERIEALEGEQTALEGALADPDTYRDKADQVGAMGQRLSELEAEIEGLYERWSELGERAG